MPHIHAEPRQHDVTASAYIVRTDGTEPLCLMHMHKKAGMLTHIGGHVELHENPWQAIIREAKEEAGYEAGELRVLQPMREPLRLTGAIAHPTPMTVNTHCVDIVRQGHFHSDFGFGFVVDHAPSLSPKEGESTDLRWMTLDDIRGDLQKGTVLPFAAEIYEAMIAEFMGVYFEVGADEFSLSTLPVELRSV